MLARAGIEAGTNSNSTRSEVPTDDREVPCTVTGNPLRLHGEGGLFDQHEAQPVVRDLGALALVVAAPLLGTADPGDGLPTVEEQRWLRVLLLLELDDEPEVRPVPVDGQRRSARPRRRGVTAQPVEPRLRGPGYAKRLVAQVEDVALAGVGTSGAESSRSVLRFALRLLLRLLRRQPDPRRDTEHHIQPAVGRQFDPEALLAPHPARRASPVGLSVPRPTVTPTTPLHPGRNP